LEEEHLMAAETSLGLPYPQSTDNVRPHEDIQNLAVALDTLLNLPAQVSGTVGSQITITATSFSALPSGGPLNVVFTNPSADYAIEVDVFISAWLGASTNDVRAGLAASGGISFSPGSLGSGGAIQNGENMINSAGSAHFSQCIPGIIIPAAAAAVTFSLQAHRTTSGTQLVSYPVLRVVPRRYRV
jgi:hypothetical protein